MASFNKVILVGNLTRDPELRNTPNGTAICRFSLAVSRQFRNADGSSREEVLFIEVDSFGKQAETISRYMAKGRPILIEGRLRLDQWENQAGEKRSRIMVAAESFQFLSSPNRQEGDSSGETTYGGRGDDGSQRRQQRGGGGGGRGGKPREEEDNSDGDDEEIPF
ncbi:MAG: single-stranded DNA-binding protein [Puniceicoccales bacterium]|jgi:single-strand DNA-binding protein|nr:single-stranded DNA-binding protein [Puniceicoccales bacterium]